MSKTLAIRTLLISLILNLILGFSLYAVYEEKNELQRTTLRHYITNQHSLQSHLNNALNNTNNKEAFVSNLILADGALFSTNVLFNASGTIRLPESLYLFHKEGFDTVHRILHTKAIVNNVDQEDINALIQYRDKLGKYTSHLDNSKIVSGNSITKINKKLEELVKQVE